MHELDVIKSACTQALLEKNDHSPVNSYFRSIADPECVLELVRMVEESITPHELETLMMLIRNLTHYLEVVKEDIDDVALPDRHDLIRRAKYFLLIYAR